MSSNSSKPQAGGEAAAIMESVPPHTYVAIMAGGVGSRFWPASREERPKQFLDILGVGKSLLRLTFERFCRLVPAENIFIVTNGQYELLVHEQLPELTPNQVLCEPSRNNTGPCVAYTAFKLLALDPEANLVIAPSDHLILDEPAFLEVIRRALDFTARNEALVTLGIQPTRPDTGYGYIRYSPLPASPQGGGDSVTGLDSLPLGEGRGGAGGAVFKVLKFTEKPPLDKAEAFLASGDYLWNAGIFVWRASSVLEAFRLYAPEIHHILSGGEKQYNTPEEGAFIERFYPTTPNISVDFAIMEHAENVFTIPSSFGWSDLGTWASLHAVGEQNVFGNVILGERALTYDTTDCLIRLPKGKLLVCRDLNGYIIVDEGDALLIWPKEKEQEIKGVTREVKEMGFGDLL